MDILEIVMARIYWTLARNCLTAKFTAPTASSTWGFPAEEIVVIIIIIEKKKKKKRKKKRLVRI